MFITISLHSANPSVPIDRKRNLRKDKKIARFDEISKFICKNMYEISNISAQSEMDVSGRSVMFRIFAAMDKALGKN